MKVTQNNTPIQLDAYLKQIQQQKAQQSDEVTLTGGTQPGKADTVELSAAARRVQQTTRTSELRTDFREDKVRQVKMDIESGTYKVDGGQIATDMLREAFENNGILNKIDTRV